MTSTKPKLIAINRDDYQAKYVGHTADGRQFFLTTPFEPATKIDEGKEFMALYIFNPAGLLLTAKISNLGPRATMNENERIKLRDCWLQELGNVVFERIEGAPFSLRKFDTNFGLIIREPDEDCDVWAVELQPGNYMAFFEPWNSGEYDT